MSAVALARVALIQRVQPVIAVGRIRMWAMEADCSLAEGNEADALGRLTMMSREAPNLGSTQGMLRQLLDLAIGNCASWARYGDMGEARTALNDVTATLAAFEEAFGAADAGPDFGAQFEGVAEPETAPESVRAAE